MLLRENNNIFKKTDKKKNYNNLTQSCFGGEKNRETDI